MRSALDNAPIVEHENLVGVLDRGDAVRDDDARSLAHHAAEAAKYFSLGVGIHRREGVVEDEDPRILGHGARDRGALLLPAREGDAALADHRVVPRREVLDVLVQLRDVSGPVELRIGELLVQTEANVLPQGDREEERLLGDVPHGAAKLLERAAGDADAIDQDLALLDVEEARDQVDHRRLARPGRADDRK